MFGAQVLAAIRIHTHTHTENRREHNNEMEMKRTSKFWRTLLNISFYSHFDIVIENKSDRLGERKTKIRIQIFFYFVSVLFQRSFFLQLFDQRLASFIMSFQFYEMRCTYVVAAHRIRIRIPFCMACAFACFKRCHNKIDTQSPTLSDIVFTSSCFSHRW